MEQDLEQVDDADASSKLINKIDSLASYGTLNYKSEEVDSSIPFACLEQSTSVHGERQTNGISEEGSLQQRRPFRRTGNP